MTRAERSSAWGAAITRGSRPSRCCATGRTVNCSKNRSRYCSRPLSTVSHRASTTTCGERPLSRLRSGKIQLCRARELAVECWQPVVRPRGLDYAQIRDERFIGGGAATLDEGPIRAYQEAARARNWNSAKVSIWPSHAAGRNQEEAIKNIHRFSSMPSVWPFLPGLRTNSWLPSRNVVTGIARVCQ